MRKWFVLACGCVAAASSQAALLYDNGPLVTHAGAGAAGADVSMASAVPNSGGSNVNTTVWRADDFTVSSGTWTVNSIDTYVYDTANPIPRWTGGTMEIRSGSVTGSVVASASITSTYSGINRVFNGAANLSNADRQVQRVNGNFGSVDLVAGQYFMVVTMTVAGINVWMPYVMDPNSANPNDPITRIGNSQVSTDSGATWAAGVVTTGSWNQAPELAFQVNGSAVPEPATMATLALGGLLMAARRRNRK